MDKANPWWPISELSDEERGRIMNMPPVSRKRYIENLKKELAKKEKR